MGEGDGPKLRFGFGQGDVEAGLAEPGAFEQELQRKGRFARSRCPFDEIEPVGRDPTTEDVVETFDPRRRSVVLQRGDERLSIMRLSAHLSTGAGPSPLNESGTSEPIFRYRRGTQGHSVREKESSSRNNAPPGFRFPMHHAGTPGGVSRTRPVPGAPQRSRSVRAPRGGPSTPPESAGRRSAPPRPSGQNLRHVAHRDRPALARKLAGHVHAAAEIAGEHGGRAGRLDLLRLGADDHVGNVAYFTAKVPPNPQHTSLQATPRA